ncbi:MAG: alpha amylase C-terminal domain-containing protein [Oscillospiraceae bacterium]|nr:alpha amylase C-terminal domain-containing protein [Oscillospiraceae bacterium]
MNELPGGKGRIFDFGKGEVQSFLMSNGVFWMDLFHGDGIRMGSVTAMLYLDYDRQNYHPNLYGGKENLDAITFLRKANRAIFSVRRNAITVAQEHTAFPLVTKPDYDGGLGFLYKWNMGWLRDMTEYLRLDPLWRKGSHSRLTNSMEYAYAENFVLTLPHTLSRREGPLISMLAGEYDDKFADLRAFYGFMMAFPGKKLSFMGNEFARFDSWDPDHALDWSLLDYERHRQFRDCVRALNHIYLKDSCLWNNDTEAGGFEWICMDDCDNSVLAFRRLDRRSREIIAICNFCPVVRTGYRLGLPRPGDYEPILSTDSGKFGGSDMELPVVSAEKVPFHGLPYSGEFTIPSLSTTYYKRVVNHRKPKET